MTVPIALVPLDGDDVPFTADQVGKCAVLRQATFTEVGERLPVPLHRDALLAWQRGLRGSHTPALDVLAAIRV